MALILRRLLTSSPPSYGITPSWCYCRCDSYRVVGSAGSLKLPHDPHQHQLGLHPFLRHVVRAKSKIRPTPPSICEYTLCEPFRCEKLEGEKERPKTSLKLDMSNIGEQISLSCRERERERECIYANDYILKLPCMLYAMNCKIH